MGQTMTTLTYPLRTYNNRGLLSLTLVPYSIFPWQEAVFTPLNLNLGLEFLAAFPHPLPLTFAWLGLILLTLVLGSALIRALPSLLMSTAVTTVMAVTSLLMVQGLLLANPQTLSLSWHLKLLGCMAFCAYFFVGCISMQLESQSAQDKTKTMNEQFFSKQVSLIIWQSFALISLGYITSTWLAQQWPV